MKPREGKALGRENVNNLCYNIVRNIEKEARGGWGVRLHFKNPVIISHLLTYQLRWYIE